MTLSARVKATSASHALASPYVVAIPGCSVFDGRGFTVDRIIELKGSPSAFPGGGCMSSTLGGIRTLFPQSQ